MATLNLQDKLKRYIYPSDKGTGQFAIMGGPGSGKSWACSLAHQSADTASIYFNYPEKEKDDYDVAGHVVNKNIPKKRISAAVKQNMALKYDPDPKQEAMSHELKSLYDLVKTRQGTTYIFVDEAHMLNQDMLEPIVKDARGHRVRFGLISQYPTDLGNNVMSTALDQVYFGIDNRQVNYLKGINVPVEEIRRRCNAADYAGVRFNKWRQSDKLSNPFVLPGPQKLG